MMGAMKELKTRAEEANAEPLFDKPAGYYAECAMVSAITWLEVAAEIQQRQRDQFEFLTSAVPLGGPFPDDYRTYKLAWLMGTLEASFLTMRPARELELIRRFKEEHDRRKYGHTF